VLANGHIIFNVNGNDEVLVFDARSMQEVARFPSSNSTGTRPVHAYLTPLLNGQQYWIALNDGTHDGGVEENTALFVDAVPTSPTYLQPVAEIPLGQGHHKASFSTTRERVVISNIDDCDDVLSVYDYSDINNIRRIGTLSATALGLDGSTPEKTCDPTGENGVRLSPHGCGTAPLSGRAYCNLTGVGQIVAIDLDPDQLSFDVITTQGSGAGSTIPSADGRYIYSVQRTPREDLDGAICQIGQLAVIDTTEDVLISEVPLRYEGADCDRSLAGTDEEIAAPSHPMITPDGETLYITVSTSSREPNSRSRQLLVLNVSDPSTPQQQDSIEVGAAQGYRAQAMMGDGRYLFIANNIDGTISQVDTTTNTVVRTIRIADPATEGVAMRLFAFGTESGVSIGSSPLP
jgi:YVTN family beta-propeller protein